MAKLAIFLRTHEAVLEIIWFAYMMASFFLLVLGVTIGCYTSDDTMAYAIVNTSLLLIALMPLAAIAYEYILDNN